MIEKIDIGTPTSDCAKWQEVARKMNEIIHSLNALWDIVEGDKE